jgi:hypothetical protein
MPDGAASALVAAEWGPVPRLHRDVCGLFAPAEDHVRDSALYEGCPSVITSAVQVVLFQSRGALAIGLLRKADFR